MAKKPGERGHFGKRAPEELRNSFDHAIGGHSQKYREKATEYLDFLYKPGSSYTKTDKEEKVKRLIKYAETGSIYETAKSELPKDYENDPLPTHYKSVKTFLAKTDLLLEPAAKENLAMAFPKGYREKAKNHFDRLVDSWMGKQSKRVFTRDHMYKTLMRRVMSDAYIEKKGKKSIEGIRSEIDEANIRKRFHEAFNILESEKSLHKKELASPRHTPTGRGEKAFRDTYYSPSGKALRKLSPRESREVERYFALRGAFKSRMPYLKNDFFKYLNGRMKRGITAEEIRLKVVGHGEPVVEHLSTMGWKKLKSALKDKDEGELRKQVNRIVSSQVDEALKYLMNENEGIKDRIIAKSERPLPNPFAGKEKRRRKVYWYAYPEYLDGAQKDAHRIPEEKSEGEYYERRVMEEVKRKPGESNLRIAESAFKAAIEKMLLDGMSDEYILTNLTDKPELIAHFVDKKRIRRQVETEIMGNIIREDKRRLASKDPKLKPFSGEAIKSTIDGWVDRYAGEEWERKIGDTLGRVKNESVMYNLKAGKPVDHAREKIREYLVEENPTLEHSPDKIEKYTDRIMRYVETKSSKEVARMELEEEGKETTEKDLDNRAASVREWLRRKRLTYGKRWR